MTPHYILIQHKNHQWIERLDGTNRLPSRYSYYDETGKVVEELNRLVDHINRLEREVELLRLYGNKDCTAMADEAMRKESKP